MRTSGAGWGSGEEGRGMTPQYTAVGFSNVLWFTNRNVIFMILGRLVDNVIFRGYWGWGRLWAHSVSIHTDLLFLYVCPPVCLSFYRPVLSVWLILCLAVQGSREEGVDESKIEKDAKVRRKNMARSDNFFLPHTSCVYVRPFLTGNLKDHFYLNSIPFSEIPVKPHVTEKMSLFVHSFLSGLSAKTPDNVQSQHHFTSSANIFEIVLCVSTQERLWLWKVKYGLMVYKLNKQDVTKTC